MSLFTLLSTALATTVGKAAAVATVTAATAGGLAATEAVDLPVLSDEPAEVTTEDQGEAPELPDAATLREDNADAAAEQAEAAEDKKEAAAERKAAGQQNGQDDADAGQSQGIGEDVSAAASDGEGPARDRVLPQTPANERAHDAGAPATVGERQDAEVRQDDGAGQDDEAPEGAEVADEHTPEDAGSQADGRGAAAAGARS